MTGIAALLAQVIAGSRPGVASSDWEPAVLASMAEHHGVGALVWEASGADAMLAVHEALDATVRAAVAREVFVQREVRAVTAALAKEGLRALLLKGTALAYSTYPRPWLRPRTDTDLLIAPADADAVSRVLGAALGYERTDALTSGSLVSHQWAFERRDSHGVRHVLDLHWKIVNPHMLADALAFDELWGTAATVPPLGEAARVPSSLASLALACIHRVAHHQGQDRLIWLYDIHLLASRLTDAEWQALSDLAVRRGIAAICLDGLRVAHGALGTTVPAGIASRLEAAAPREPSRRFVSDALNRRGVLMSDLAVLPGWSDRLRLLREHAFPPAAFIRRRYGVTSPIWLPALYVHRLVTGAYKWVRP
jgi:Uncharacterised nucleotidyltransferase